MNIFRILLVGFLAFALSSCAGLNLDEIGIDETDNAVQCINIEVTGWTPGSGGSTRRVELPAAIGTEGMTIDQAISLLEACQ